MSKPAAPSNSGDDRGKSESPTHKVELDVLLSHPSSGTIPEERYTVENVTGNLMEKDDDILFYRIRFVQGKEPDDANNLIVKMCPAEPQHQRRDGRPEFGFMVAPPTEIFKGKDGSTYACEPHYAVVFNTANKVSEIYFTLEDCDVTPNPPPAKGLSWNDLPAHAAGSKALWKLGVNESAVLHDMFPDTWIPLKPVHPDPRVDPGVPIQECPQRTPRWYQYRADTKYKKELGGQLSASRWHKLLPMFPKDELIPKTPMKGSPLMRFGRITEPHIFVALLSALDKDVKLYECGTFPHPSIKDTAATPDALIVDPHMSFKTLPEWYQRLLTQEHVAGRGPDPNTLDFTRGIVECKSMMTRDARGRGPDFLSRHVPQMYGEMICANVYWSLHIRYCRETGECRSYRLYRRPDIANSFNALVKRMRRELIQGIPYNQATKHDTNTELIKTCKQHEEYYNDAAKKRYTEVPWNAANVALFEKKCDEYDLVASGSNGTTTIREAKHGKEREKGTTKKVKRARDESQDVPSTQTQGDRGLMDAWAEIAGTTSEINRCVKNGDWDELLGQAVLKRQILQYIDLEVRLNVFAERKRPKGPTNNNQ